MNVTLVQAIFIPALALGVGWGIRGQFGGQRGAAVAGAILGLTMAWLFGYPQPLALATVSAVAMSFGGAMTYGQTIGLTHDLPDSATYGWGMFGLTLKGVVWIGLAGTWIGIAAGHTAYSIRELAALVVGQFLFGLVGVALLNRPHDPPDRLPRLYFSKRHDDAPRVEWWGGLWFGYVALLLYVGLIKMDRFAFGMGIFGAAGGLGFPFGQTLQVWGRYRAPFGERAQRWIDWWKVMEVTFGGVAGAMLGLGWWLFDGMGLKAGIASLPALPRILDGSLIGLYAVLFVASILRVTPVRVAVSAPFSEGLFMMLPAFTAGFAPAVYLAGVLSAFAGVANVRRFFAERFISARIAAVLAILIAAGALAWGWFLGGGDVRRWLLFVLWFQTIATVTEKGITRRTLFPADAKTGRHGYLGASARGWGSALPVELALIAGAVVLTVLVTR